MTDDLNRVLSEPVSEPDPVLASNPAPEAPPACRENAPVPPFLRDKGKQPKTSEIFTSIVPPGQQGPAAGTETGGRHEDRLAAGTPASDDLLGRIEPETAKHRTLGAGSGSDDSEQFAEPRTTWFIILLLSYSSAITLALFWVLWTGRSLKTAEAPALNPAPVVEERSSKPPERESLPPIPPGNITTLDKAIRIGEVEVEPLAIELSPVELVRSIDRDDFRHEETNSLILKLRLTNISSDHKFAPLDRRLIRDQNSPLDRTYVATPGGKIQLFPLAVDSEWTITGQSFPVLASGETVETLLASEPVTEDQLDGELTWRIRLRVGLYRTDVLGVRFTRRDVRLNE